MGKLHPTRFADAAGRLDGFVAEIKARQFDSTGAKPPPPTPLRPGLDPDAAWRHAYATRTVRPASPHEAPLMPEFVVAPPPERPEFPDRRPAPTPAAAGEDDRHIGAALGKPSKKRGVLARLGRGRQR